MAFIATPESVQAAIEFWGDFRSWMQDHPMFFGCSGMVTWVAILVWAVRWPILHVRFV